MRASADAYIFGIFFKEFFDAPEPKILHLGLDRESVVSQ